MNNQARREAIKKIVSGFKHPDTMVDALESLFSTWMEEELSQNKCCYKECSYHEQLRVYNSSPETTPKSGEKE